MITINKTLIAIAAALAQVQLALAGGSAGGSTITGSEYVGIAIAALAAIGVYAVPYASRQR